MSHFTTLDSASMRSLAQVAQKKSVMSRRERKMFSDFCVRYIESHPELFLPMRTLFAAALSESVQTSAGRESA